jgi:uncharacterized protein
MKIARALILLSLLVSANIGLSQHVVLPRVEVLGKATDRSIKLRWAPSTPALWRFANQYGYTVERITISQGNRVLKLPIRKILTSSGIKPSEEALWKRYSDGGDNVLIAAQAIFGESFQVSTGTNTDALSSIQKSKELELRFSFALFAADQSSKVAELSGLYIEDESVVANEKYLYRVFANVPQALYPADTGFVFMGLHDYKPLPKIQALAASSGDHTSLVTWDGQLTARIYNSFWLERSDDRATFKRITSTPIVNSSKAKQAKSDLIFKSDSLPSNNTRYFYRVRGIDAFGEVGPASDTVSIIGRDAFVSKAVIEGHSIDKEGFVTLRWSFSSEGDLLLKYFELSRHDPKLDKISTIKTPVADTCRMIVDLNPRSSNYYVITAVDHFGRKTNSFPYLVQLEDSIPPDRPRELQGKIDSTGLVHLNWRSNSESDVFGYAIFKANFLTDEFIQLPGPLITSTSFVDTVLLSNLTGKIYYKIKALDHRHNYSEYSDALVLTKPDKISPTQPVFVEAKYDSAGVYLRWQPSESADVHEHLLYRKLETDGEWSFVAGFTKSDSTVAYLDQDVRHREKYLYTMISIDETGNESEPAVPVSCRWIKDHSFPQIEDVFYKVAEVEKEIYIRWDFIDPSAVKFLIYKSSNGNPLTLFKTVDGSTTELVDNYKASDSQLEYKIAVGFSTGEMSKPSKSILIKM